MLEFVMCCYRGSRPALYTFAEMIFSADSRHCRVLPTTLDGCECLPPVSGASVQSP